MTDLLGFWSYVHADDELDGGRATQLGRDIVGHYEAAKNEVIKLFLDHDDLHWGDQWRDQIDEALSNVAFFIPVITPRYFGRVECRRELQFFADRAEQLHISELILPILYIDVPELHEDMPKDPLMRIVKRIQWEPWTELRFADRTSPEYRMAVDKLARELVRRVAAVEATDIVAAAEAIEDSASDGSGDPGVLERLAALEEAMPRWSETMIAIGKEIEAIGNVMERGTTDMDKGEAQGKGFVARLTVARRVANELAEPVERLEGLGQFFVSDLSEIDAGIRVLLQRIEEEVVEDPSHLVEVCEFLQTIRDLSNSAHEGLGAVEGMITASASMDGMSKDMRAPLRRMKNSLTSMFEAREITDEWAALVDAADIDCSGLARLTPAESLGSADPASPPMAKG